MRGNPWRLLGLLGLLAVAGLFSQDGRVWWGFLGFFGFFSLPSPLDERLEAAYARAARNGFALSMAGMAVLVALVMLGSSRDALGTGISLVFAASLLVFTLSARVYNRRGT